jgi:DNA mismatch repair protein MutL
MLMAALRDALRAPDVVPAMGATTGATWSAGAAAAESAAPADHHALFAEAPAAYAPGRFGRVLGQVQDTFIVATSDDEVFFLDQHVVHERVLFERLESDLATGAPPSQTLLFPETVDLPPAARALLGRWRPTLARLGFAFEPGPGDALVVSAVPALLKGDEPRRVLEAAVDELGGPKAETPAMERALAFVACRGAIKANTPLAREEMERLVADLDRTRTPYFCPHGRPIVSRVSMHDIRRELKRTW